MNVNIFALFSADVVLDNGIILWVHGYLTRNASWAPAAVNLASSLRVIRVGGTPRASLVSARPWATEANESLGGGWPSLGYMRSPVSGENARTKHNENWHSVFLWHYNTSLFCQWQRQCSSVCGNRLRREVPLVSDKGSTFMFLSPLMEFST